MRNFNNTSTNSLSEQWVKHMFVYIQNKHVFYYFNDKDTVPNKIFYSVLK